VELTARQAAGGIEINHVLVETGFATIVGQGPIPLGWQPALGVRSVPTDHSLDLTFRGHAPGPEGMDLPLSLAGRVRIGSGELEVESLSLTAGLGRLEGQVSVAGGWEDWLSQNPDSPALRGELELAELSLEVLPASALGIGALGGKLSGWAKLSGTLDRPEPSFELELAEATIKVRALPRLERLGARLAMTGDRITLTDLSGTMGAGLLEGELTVQTRDGNLWDSPLNATILGKIRGSDLLLVDDPNLRLRGHVNLDLQGTQEELRVGGTVRITSGRYARRLTLLPDLQVRGGATAGVSAGLHLLPIESALGQRIHLDVGIETTRDFQVRTHILDADFVADLHLRGQASLAHLEGVISSSSGILRLPGTALRLDSMLATFPADNPLQPRLVAQASGRRHGVQVQLGVHGPLSNPEIQISSIPVYAPQELWTLVTTGSLPATLRESGPMGQAALVGSYLADELAAWYTGDSMEDTTSFFDRFTFVSGRDISESGRPSMVVEFALSDNLYLQGEFDVWEDYNAGIVLRFRF
jgi:hypothetical protein